MSTFMNMFSGASGSNAVWNAETELIFFRDAAEISDPGGYRRLCEFKKLDTALLPEDRLYYQFNSEAIVGGLLQLWVPIHARIELAQQFDNDERRDFEHAIRQEMTELDQSDPWESEHWRDLRTLHYLSVTAEQGMMCRAGFLLFQP